MTVQTSLLHQLGGAASVAPREIEIPGERIAGDAYYTPDRLARAIVSELREHIYITGTVWEPHVGGGAFARAILDGTHQQIPNALPVLLVSDIDPDAVGLYGYENFPHAVRSHPGMDFLASRGYRAEWIIGNPPYDRAEAHTRHALRFSRHVVFLLRLAFVESLGRRNFWRDHPARHIWALSRRPSFTGGRTDSAAYGVFWWDRCHQGDTTFTPCWDWT